MRRFAVLLMFAAGCGVPFEAGLFEEPNPFDDGGGEVDGGSEASHEAGTRRQLPVRAPAHDLTPPTVCMLLEADGVTPTGERFPCFLGIDWQWQRGGEWVSCEKKACPDGATCSVNTRKGVCR